MERDVATGKAQPGAGEGCDENWCSKNWFDHRLLPRWNQFGGLQRVTSIRSRIDNGHYVGRRTHKTRLRLILSAAFSAANGDFGMAALFPRRVDRLAHQVLGVGAGTGVEFLYTPAGNFGDIEIAFLVHAGAMHVE